MLFRSVTLAAFAITLSACTTATDGSTPSFTQKSPVETRWVGQSAGIFFAKFGPPLSDTESGSSTVYNWRGGYKKATIPAKFEEGKDGKRPADFARPHRLPFLHGAAGRLQRLQDHRRPHDLRSPGRQRSELLRGIPRRQLIVSHKPKCAKACPNRWAFSLFRDFRHYSEKNCA